MTVHRLHAKPLTMRERMVAASFADGWSVKQVAFAFGLSEESVKDCVRRAKRKYIAAGRPTFTVIDLLKRFEEDGYL